MAVPILAIIIIGSIIVAFAIFKDQIITILKELAVDVIFAVIFTIVINLFIPLNETLIVSCVAGITVLIFIIHMLSAPSSSGHGSLMPT